MSGLTCFQNVVPAGMLSATEDDVVSTSLWVQDGKFVQAPSDLSKVDRVVDLDGSLVSPGFLDIQCNGAFDIDFTTPHLRVENVNEVLRQLPEHGVTEIFGTIITTDTATYAHTIGIFLEVIDAQRRGEGVAHAKLAGIHLEGPFLHPHKKGAHRQELLKAPREMSGMDADAKEMGDEEFDAVWGATYGRAIPSDVTVMITIAPELPGALQFIKLCAKRGIITSIGHSTASLELATAAIAAGSSMVTHLYNAMPAFSHREPGIIGLLGEHTHAPVYMGLICDGVHVHPAAIDMAFRCRPSQCLLVTDSMRSLGAGLGERTYGDMAVTVHAGKQVGDGVYNNRHVVLKGTQTLAGAVAPLDFCVRFFRDSTKCSAADALSAATSIPRAAVGHRRATFAVGEPATFLVLTADLHLRSTYVAGQEVKESSS